MRTTVVGGVVVTVALVAGGLVLGQASAQTPPERVLQAVNVDLGSDGALHAISGVNVRKVDGEEEPRSDEAEYDPTKTSGQLPVRVTTAYRAGDRTGTDLADIKGYSGPLEIDVTVQNTTVHPEKVSYDVDGARRSQYALVGVPLTVVASADLGEHAVDRVVTRSDAGEAVTNGVLSQGRSGNAQVQWASLLAPPQLAPSVTFTLVENARDFQMPSFDLSVQPGLAADSSMQALLRSAFSDDGSSRLQLEAQTIRLVSRVTGVLAEAGAQLGQVRSQLDFSAGQLGSRTIGDLTSSTETLAGSTKALSADLDALGANLGDALTTTRDSAVGQMSTTVSAVSRLLGDTSRQPAAPRLKGSGCTAGVANTGGENTVYGQLTQVATLLKGLQRATTSCQDSIEAKLAQAIGETDEAGQPVCPPHAESAVCTIDAAGEALTSLVSDLESSKKAAIEALDPADVLGTTNAKMAELKSAVTTLQADAAALRTDHGHNHVTDDVVDELQALSQQVDEVRSSLKGTDSITWVVDGLHQTATENLGELQGEGSTEGSMAQETADIGAEVCDLVRSQSLSDSDARKLLALSTGKDCDGQALDTADGSAPDGSAPAGYPAGSLATRLDQQVAAWQQVSEATSSTGSAYSAVASIDEDLQAVREQIDNAIQDAKGNQQPRIGALLDKISGLYDGAAEPASTDCGKHAGDFKDPVNQLAFAVTRMTDCKKGAAEDAISKAFDDVRADVTSRAGEVHDQLARVDESRRHSDEQLAALFDQASGGLDEGARTVTHDGAKAIDGQQARLRARTKRISDTISSSVTHSLRSIDRSVASSTRDLQASADLLDKDLRNVLADLGSRDRRGSGLLGIISAQAAKTRTSAARLADTSAEASRFGNVRGEDLAGLFLEQAQLQRALELQAAFPAFGTKLPQGSRHVTVFAFHMRGIE